MANVRLSRALCAAVADVLTGSHATLDALFIGSGAPGEPPDLPHDTKWKEWLFRAGQDPEVDSLAVVGNLIEEFMDVIPDDLDALPEWSKLSRRIERELEKIDLIYHSRGRVTRIDAQITEDAPIEIVDPDVTMPMLPSSVEELLGVIVRGLPRAMSPFINRRKGAVDLSFRSEYDVQDLLHALLRPWISDIRTEEFCPSYAGSNARMDFLLPEHSMVIETKVVRSRTHAKRIGDELIIDIAHYRAHPQCDTLWCVIYDPDNLISNVGGLSRDLEGNHENAKGRVQVKTIIV